VTVYLQDPDLTIHQGDALETLRQLPDETVHMCVTSPPFYGLRDYGVEGQIGLEETPEQWVTNLVNVFREVRRVLRADGTLWLEVGDSYAANRSYQVSDSKHKAHDFADGGKVGVPDGCKPKDLIGAPWLLAFALRKDGWWLRADIIWARPNPMPESVTDRPTKSHSYLFLLAKSARYFYDADAVREPHTEPWRNGTPEERLKAKGTDGHHATHAGWDYRERVYNPAGRNARSVWAIPTQPLAEPHYAAFPEELARRAILAGTSERGVCPQCGAPWRRVTETSFTPQEDVSVAKGVRGHPEQKPMDKSNGWQGMPRGSTTTSTVAWEPTCHHDVDTGIGPPIPATVLDPFVGSGTTALVARKHGRRTIGIELNPAYCQIAERRTRQLSLLGDAA
jgi:DNA modification methylase